MSNPGKMTKGKLFRLNNLKDDLNEIIADIENNIMDNQVTMLSDVEGGVIEDSQNDITPSLLRTNSNTPPSPPLLKKITASTPIKNITAVIRAAVEEKRENGLRMKIYYLLI